jgi:CubicO group peptidase (beta-lactamase class C family)
MRLLALLFAVSAFSPAQALDIGALLRVEASAKKIPGLSAAVVTRQGVVFDGAVGLSDVENAVPSSTETIYRLASISKVFTAVIAMRLHERGLLDLDAPVQKYCPAFPEKEWPLTARQLLSHLGGVRHYIEKEPTNTSHYSSIESALWIFKLEPLLHEPGTKFLYTTYGYSVLGCVIEGASGKRYLEALNDEILLPAALTHTRDDDRIAVVPHRAQGYRLTADHQRLVNSDLADTSSKIPGGGLAATAADVARFGLAAVDGTLVSRETRELMFTEARPTTGGPPAYGLGWCLPLIQGAPRQVWHTGHQEKVSNVLFVLPDDGISVAILSNFEDATVLDAAKHIAFEMYASRATR